MRWPLPPNRLTCICLPKIQPEDVRKALYEIYV